MVCSSGTSFDCEAVLQFTTYNENNVDHSYVCMVVNHIMLELTTTVGWLTYQIFLLLSQACTENAHYKNSHSCLAKFSHLSCSSYSHGMYLLHVSL